MGSFMDVDTNQISGDCGCTHKTLQTGKKKHSNNKQAQSLSQPHSSSKQASWILLLKLSY